jgi:hypothetical protein
MPNHCDHRLVIVGPVAAITDLITLMQGETCFDFNKLIPMPQELKGTTAPTQRGQEAEAARLKAKYGHSDWYGWNCANWGTKWNAYSLSSSLDGGPLEILASAHDKATRQVEYEFQTAWSPPMPIIEGLVKRFLTCTFTWYGIEEQPAWGSLTTYAGGEQIEGGFCEGDPKEIWALSDWHARFKYEDDEEDE